ncbi:MAG: ribosome small subunit-dependent GTPase A [Elusimicrobiota bacterium]
MELRDLGFDGWYGKQEVDLGGAERRVARVTAVDRDGYLVRDEKSEVSAQLAGRLRFSSESSGDLPCVGDWAFVRYHNSGTLAVIHGVLPRKSVLRRKAAGRKIDYQLIAANIDVAFIVQSCDVDFNLRRLERYLVMVSEGHIKPVLILSKSDLIGPHDLEERISRIRQAKIDSGVLALSNKTGFGLDQVQDALKRAKTYCLLGSSGVGKTTLLNHLVGREAFETKTVREKDGKGRHATTRRHLIVLDNGAMLIDNPGMRELGLIGTSAGLGESFCDIHELSKRCRFRDCTHVKERGCAILMAVEAGEVSEERYRSHLKLARESEYHEMSCADKRKKDREFGKMVKSVMKHKKKR